MMQRLTPRLLLTYQPFFLFPWELEPEQDMLCVA